MVLANLENQKKTQKKTEKRQKFQLQLRSFPIHLLPARDLVSLVTTKLFLRSISFPLLFSNLLKFWCSHIACSEPSGATSPVLALKDMARFRCGFIDGITLGSVPVRFRGLKPSSITSLSLIMSQSNSKCSDEYIGGQD